jgi:hypothetical protein
VTNGDAAREFILHFNCRATLTLVRFVLAMRTDNRGVRSPYLFRSYVFQQERATAFNRNPDIETTSARLVDVCRATSAASQYFPSVKLPDTGHDTKSIKFTDGSNWAANPSLEAYREIQSMHSDVNNPIDIMLSIGCGIPKRSLLSNILSGRNPTAVHNWQDVAVELMMQEKSKYSEFEYHRLSGPDLPSDLDQSEWRFDFKGEKTFEKTFEKIETLIDDYCGRHEKDLKACAKALVALRERRAATYQWEGFAYGYTYSCKLCEEGCAPPPFDRRADFFEHLQRSHDSPPETEEFLPGLQKIISESRTP